MHFTAIFRATASGFSNEVSNYLFYPNSRGENLTRNCGLFYSICTVIFWPPFCPTSVKDFYVLSMQHLFCNLDNIFKQFFRPQTPILHGEPLDEGGVSRMMGLLHALNRRLASTGFLALTDHPTLADLAIFVTVSAVEAMQFMDMVRAKITHLLFTDNFYP